MSVTSSSTMRTTTARVVRDCYYGSLRSYHSGKPVFTVPPDLFSGSSSSSTHVIKESIFGESVGVFIPIGVGITSTSHRSGRNSYRFYSSDTSEKQLDNTKQENANKDPDKIREKEARNSNGGDSSGRSKSGKDKKVAFHRLSSINPALDTAERRKRRNKISIVHYLRNLNKKPMSANLFQSLGLVEFSSKELNESFDQLDLDKDGFLNEDEVRGLVQKWLKNDPFGRVKAEKHVRIIMNIFQAEVKQDSKDGEVVHRRISKEHFVKTMVQLAEKIDNRVYPIAFSCLMTGLTLGILTPVIPFMVQEMGLSQSQYGIYIASFAVTKMLMNVPAGFLVERYGRKPFYVWPTGLVGISMGSLAFVNTFQQLCATRLITGVCVAMLTSSASNSMMDLGTRLNMTRTFAPVGIAFNTGIALGPALGGLLVTQMGMQNTFLAVGGSFVALMFVNQVLIVETAPKLLQGTLSEAMQDTVKQWKPLIGNVKFQDLLVLNGAFWISSAGGFSTLLPLILIGPQFNLDVSQTGIVFAGFAGISVLSTRRIAILCDKYGKEKTLLGGTIVLGSSIATIPFLPGGGMYNNIYGDASASTSDPLGVVSAVDTLANAEALTNAGIATSELFSYNIVLQYTGLSLSAIGAFSMWALGQAAFNSAPNSLVTDYVTQPQRAQALSILRISSDLGVVFGAAMTGYLADVVSPDAALLSLSGILFSNAILFHVQRMRKGGYPKIDRDS